MKPSKPSGQIARMSAIELPGCAMPFQGRNRKNPTLRQVLAYRNPAVVSRIAKDNDLSENEAQTLFLDTLRFLWVAGTFGRVSPPPMVDEGWHAFLLFTMDYEKFCHRFFGGLLHHRPNRPEDKPDGGKGIRRSMAIVSEHLGQDLSINWDWPDLTAMTACSCKVKECGGCCSN